jgi:hypothetical protein
MLTLGTMDFAWAVYAHNFCSYAAQDAAPVGERSRIAQLNASDHHERAVLRSERSGGAQYQPARHNAVLVRGLQLDRARFGLKCAGLDRERNSQLQC